MELTVNNQAPQWGFRHRDRQAMNLSLARDMRALVRLHENDDEAGMRAAINTLLDNFYSEEATLAHAARNFLSQQKDMKHLEANEEDLADLLSVHHAPRLARFYGACGADLYTIYAAYALANTANQMFPTCDFTPHSPALSFAVERISEATHPEIIHQHPARNGYLSGMGAYTILVDDNDREDQIAPSENGEADEAANDPVPIYIPRDLFTGQPYL